MMAITYGYCRCSLDSTKQDIMRQERELLCYGVSKENIFTEYAHGTERNRKELNRLLNIVDNGDTIVATELSRITRSTKDLIEILEIAKEKHVKLVLGGFICDCSAKELDPVTEGMLKMMGVFAELERNILSQRVKSGLENCRHKGVVLGRPQITKENLPITFLKYYPMYNSKNINISEFARLAGCSRKSIYKYIKIAEK